MTIRTTYFGAIGGVVKPEEDDLVLGVVRYPRDFVERVTDRNIPAIAPPDGLLNAYKTVEEAADRDGEPHPSAIAWQNVNFEDRYREHLYGAGQQQILDELRDFARDRIDIWLVCWEKDVRYCHRRLLADVLVDDLDLDVDVEHYPGLEELEAADVSDEPRDSNLFEFQEGSA